jgi:rsbT co-antagonist protein RsbR
MHSSDHASPLDLDLADGLLLQVASGAPIVISIYDMAGTILLHAGAGLKKLGLAENQLRGQSVFAAFAGADEALRLIRAALDGKQSTNTQDLGETVWDNWFGPVYSRDGKQLGAISISTDVTERERSRQALALRLQEIETQNLAILSMSAPIIEVWQGVLVVPVVGQLDANRASLLIERLLTAVGERGARYAIIDLTAVDVIDTATAQYVFRMISALRLLGTQGLVSGIRASVAQALVGLGVDLSQVTSMGTLHAALRHCMRQ